MHRLLLDLAEEGVAERTPSGEWELSYRAARDYRPAARAHRAAAAGAALSPKRSPRRRGETVNLNALSGLNGVCIDKVRGNEGMQLDMRIGSRGPLHCGGAGKAMLAYMHESEQAKVFWRAARWR